MTLEEMMEELESLGTEQTRNTFIRHGANFPIFGVKIGDLKKLVKYVKKDYELGIALYNTGNYDAMYLAGMAINAKMMTKETLQEWMSKVNCYAMAEYTVAGVAAESDFAVELANEWIDSDVEIIATAGWNTYSNYILITQDEKLDLVEIHRLLDKIEKNIHHAPNRVRYTMNQFVIAVGASIQPLHGDALCVANVIGKVHVNLGNTSCKVPLATEYIERLIHSNKIGVKKATCRC